MIDLVGNLEFFSFLHRTVVGVAQPVKEASQKGAGFRIDCLRVPQDASDILVFINRYAVEIPGASDDLPDLIDAQPAIIGQCARDCISDRVVFDHSDELILGCHRTFP